MPFSMNSPQAQIATDRLRATVCLPDANNGFYRGTRFDWSGVVSSLEYEGHQYYAPWYTKFVPTVPDFIFEGAEVVAGARSAITGPAEEFPQPQGYDTAKVGETFVKIGVGVLRKPDDSPYSCYRDYEMVDTGTWRVRTSDHSAEFEQDVTDSRSGCGYRYRKTLSLGFNRPQLMLEHRLWNTGRRAIECEQYNHNFLTLDHAPVGPDLTLNFPFWVRAAAAPDIVTIRGQQIGFVRPLANQDVAGFPIMGFENAARDYDITIENRSVGAGLRITGSRPMTRLALWAIRSVLSIEPFIDVSVAPGGGVMAWTYTYTCHTVET
jgi:hypothetical protein